MDVIHELPEQQMWMWNSDGDVVWATGSQRMLDVLRALPLRRTRREALFWMDTFSIPVIKEGSADEEEKRKLKKRAINSMAQIYAGAVRVLVLDPELQLLPREHISDNTLLALYIKISRRSVFVIEERLDYSGLRGAPHRSFHSDSASRNSPEIQFTNRGHSAKQRPVSEAGSGASSFFASF
jgi:hypothetical protein